MKLNKKTQDFNRRWNIRDKSSQKEKFQKFLNRIFNILGDIDRHVSRKSISEFCNELGIIEKWESQRYGSRTWSLNIINALKQEENPKKFLRIIELIFELEIHKETDLNHFPIYSKDILYRKVAEAIEVSDIDASITKKNGDVIIYKSGEELLDKELVNKAISFLSGLPEQYFLDALKDYKKNTPLNRVKSADSLRRTLEEFLMIKLSNQKGLSENIKELGKQLKEKCVNNHIRILIVSKILNYLDQPFFNENSKHKAGKISNAENEFLIYEVALLLRYIQEIL